MKSPYRRRVPKKHQRVLLALHRVYPEPIPARRLSEKSGVKLGKVYAVLRKLRRAEWVTRQAEWPSYSMPVYGLRLTRLGYQGVNQLMTEHRWKRRHIRVPVCKWDPDRIEGERHGTGIRAGT